jgi:hypothetical protein
MEDNLTEKWGITISTVYGKIKQILKEMGKII